MSKKREEAIRILQTARAEMQRRNPGVDLYEDGTTIEETIKKLESLNKIDNLVDKIK